MWTTRATWIALALTIVLLARGLPAETFFVGDPGVKLIAARAAISHPAKPFDIALPEIGDERVAFVEPFFEVHDGHAHALTSEVFPALSAPFIAAFGIRGAYVWPALGFLLAVWSCARLASILGTTPSSSTASRAWTRTSPGAITTPPGRTWSADGRIRTAAPRSRR